MNEAENTAQAVEQTAAQWLSRQDGPAWTDETRDALDAWLNADTRHRVAYLRLRAAWQKADVLRAQPVFQVMPAARPQPTLPRYSSWRIAAGLLLVCALGTLLVVRQGGADVRYATHVGESRTVALADGSRLTLNTDTQLRTAPAHPRKVWLDGGEAYFDIAHDPAHPFVIASGHSLITVLGTRFTVRREGGTTRVLVAQGRVRLNDNDVAVELVHNEEAIAKAGTITRATRSDTQTAHQMAWREGRIVFDQTTLAAAAAEFNRYNQRQLIVTDPAAARLVIGGSFAPTNVDGFVRLLKEGFGVRAERRGDRIVLTR